MVGSPEGNPLDVIDEMVQVGVLSETGQGDYRITDDFKALCDRFERKLATESRSHLESELEDLPFEAADASTLLDLGDNVPSVVAELLALVELSDDNMIPLSKTLAMTAVLDSFGDEPPPSHGAPTVFLPVAGRRVPLLAMIYEKAIVYVWLDDCDPCDTVRHDLDEIFGDVSDDLALFAVYGPGSKRLLTDEYGVPGGPTVLFFHEGEVDARLYGAHYQDVLATEIDKHRRL